MVKHQLWLLQIHISFWGEKVMGLNGVTYKQADIMLLQLPLNETFVCYHNPTFTFSCALLKYFYKKTKWYHSITYQSINSITYQYIRASIQSPISISEHQFNHLSVYQSINSISISEHQFNHLSVYQSINSITYQYIRAS